MQARQAAGSTADVNGRALFLRTAEGCGPQLLLLHGYPSSSYDWRLVLDRLSGQRTACFDLLGFGLSEKPREHLYSLLEQADGSMVLEAASLTPSQKVLRSRFGGLAARLSTQRGFRLQFGRIFSAAHPLTRDEAADQWSLLAYRGGHRILHRLTYYLHERVSYAESWHGALRDWPGRLDLAWALRDPLATEAVLDAVLELRPHAPVTRFAELGHYPSREEPEAIAHIIERIASG